MAWSVSVELRDMPRYDSPLSLPLAGSHHPFCRYRFTTILATLVMTHDKDTSQRKAKQEKPVIRRDKVVVTKVTEQELAQIKSSAGQCGMTRSDFIRARALGYKPRQRLSDAELDGLRQLAACRTDMVNFANALHGLTDNEKIKLQTVNSYPAGTTNEEVKEEDA